MMIVVGNRKNSQNFSKNVRNIAVLGIIEAVWFILKLDAPKPLLISEFVMNIRDLKGMEIADIKMS